MISKLHGEALLMAGGKRAFGGSYRTWQMHRGEEDEAKGKRGKRESADKSSALGKEGWN